jgi:SAM-dependent methyltransferase
MTANPFEPCGICGTDDWQPVYSGPVRDGAFGNRRDDAEVARCGGCGVERLAEAFCFDDSLYATAQYRERLAQPADTEAYLKTHDPLQRHTLEALWPTSLRGLTIADIGCAGGSFLDHVAGTARRLVAVEPAVQYQENLRQRGYAVFDSTGDAAGTWAGKVDLAVSVQVIEHVADPRGFLAGIAALLAPGGRLLVSTPNRNDILMEMLPDDFPAFFYRTVHRWYFDAAALAACARRAGLEPVETRHIHRYTMANALHWLRDRRPRGADPLAPLDGTTDGFWKGWLEASGRADCLFMTLKRAGDA